MIDLAYLNIYYYNLNRMRRNHNDPAKEVNLFVGNCQVIIVNNNRQIDYAFRTIRLTERVLYTYHNPLNSVQPPKGKQPSLTLQQLVKHEYEYKIISGMRPKLLLYRQDPQVVAYLKELKAPDLKPPGTDKINIVAIAIEDEVGGRYINGFIFTAQEQALRFYQSFNQAIATLIYLELINSGNLPFNFKLANRMGDILNGRCIIDPEDFMDGKDEEVELSFIYDLLKLMRKESLHNFREDLFQMKLHFRIEDEQSKDYACKFISSLEERIQKLSLNRCELRSQMVAQVLLPPPFKLIERLTDLVIIDLSNNNLSDDILTTTGTLLKFSKKLHQFNFSHNQINFEKEGILSSFLVSIKKYKLILDFSYNKISNPHTVLRYFVNADGNIPIESIDISQNPFKSEHLSFIAKTYLQRKEMYTSYTLKLKISQLQFEDPKSFEFLTFEHRLKLPTALSIPLSITRLPYRKKGKEVSTLQLQADQYTLIDQLLKKYGVEIFRGNFYKMKKIRDEILAFGVDESVIKQETRSLRMCRVGQEQAITRKIQDLLNFNLKPQRILSELNESITFARRKGLTGEGVNCLAYIHYRVQKILQRWDRQGNLGLPYRQMFYQRKSKYAYLLEECSAVNFINIPNYQTIIEKNDGQLIEMMKKQSNNMEPEVVIAYKYLLLEEFPKVIDRIILMSCLSDPQLSAAHVVRTDKFTKIKFWQIERLAKAVVVPTKSQVEIMASYGVESYKFSQAFIESWVSSSGYGGMLSQGKYQFDQQPIVTKFLQVFNNFMQILYQTPEQLSDQAILYISTITDYFMDKQNQKENDLKCLLVQELIIRMITYFDSQRHKPLKRGIILSICEYMFRRVAVEDQLVYRMMAFLMKTESYRQEEICFHESSSKLPWEGKIDWRVKETSVVKELIVSRGKIKVSVADVSNQKLEMWLEVDELSTVGEIWLIVKENIEKISEFTNINKKQIDYYWLCGTKNHGFSWDFKFLPSYQHIGQLIFSQLYQPKLFLRRIVYSLQYQSIPFLKEIKYEDLLCLFVQARQSFREAGNALLGEDQGLKVRLTSQIVWIETLIEQELMLGTLRRMQSEESQKKYREERQKIINECLTIIYTKYLPSNANLSEQNRSALIMELRGKINMPIPKDINQTIRQHIVGFIGKLGVCSLTTTISNSTDGFVLYVNNRYFCFEDRTAKPAKKIRVEFKHLLWLGVVDGEKPCLKFDVIEEIGGQNCNRYQFTIQGEGVWLAQCFYLLVNACKIRVSSQMRLLYPIEDSTNGMTDVSISVESNILRDVAGLEITKYFDFRLLRSQRPRFVINQQKRQVPIESIGPKDSQLSRSIVKNQDKSSSEIQHKRRSYRISTDSNPPKQDLMPNQSRIQKKELPPIDKAAKQNLSSKKNIQLPISPIAEQSVQQSSKGISERNLEIEQIIQTEKEKENEEEVSASRRSWRGGSNRGRRNSRNR